MLTMADITRFTNKKGFMLNAGMSGTMYPHFKPFSVSETMQHIGVYMLNGLSPSPQVLMHFDSQARDPTNENDMCHRVFGTCAKRRHKEFKCFLAVQDPVRLVPPRKTPPNWKLQPLLKHATIVSKEAIILGQNISIDKETIGCKGRHPDILQITCKKEGDGFQCNGLCSDGYTFTFFFRNKPAPKRYLDKGISPSHARFFVQLE